MIKGDQIRARLGQDKTLRPIYLDPTDSTRLEKAQTCLSLFLDAVGKTRGELKERTQPFIKGEGDKRLNAGLVEVLTARCSFETPAAIEPSRIRNKVFELSAGSFPVGVERPEQRQQILEEAARELGISPTVVEKWLFADLKDEQRLETFRTLTPERLVHRYNVALAQAVLLYASRVRIRVPVAPRGRLRQMFRYLKFFRLLFAVESESPEHLNLVVDGPRSVLDGTRAYGLRFASFLPALLLAEEFSMEAELVWKRKKCKLELDARSGLRSHYRDTGAWIPAEMKQLRIRLEQTLPSGIRLADAEPVVSLGGRDVYVPDFCFSRQDKSAYLEVIWPWKKLAWARYFKQFKDHAPENALLCLSRKALPGNVATPEDPRIVLFKVTPLPEPIARAVARLIPPTGKLL